MIFDRHVAWNILEGKVSRFYRPVRGARAGWAEGELHKIDVDRREDGEIVRKQLGVIRIVDVDQVHLADVTDEDARTAGWSALARMHERWRQKYGTGPLDPDARCWVVTFELSTDHIPRLLHQDSSHGYTHDPRQALADEPEAVDRDSQLKITSEAGRVYSVTHADEQRKRNARSLSAQLKEETARAQREGIDIDENVQRIRAELEEIRRKRQDAA